MRHGYCCCESVQQLKQIGAMRELNKKHNRNNDCEYDDTEYTYSSERLASTWQIVLRAEIQTNGFFFSPLFSFTCVCVLVSFFPQIGQEELTPL